jgi:hypothetical protein
VREQPRSRRQADFGQAILDAGCDLCWLESAATEREGNIVVDAQEIKQRVVLKDHTDSAPEGIAIGFAVTEKTFASDPELALPWVE